MSLRRADVVLFVGCAPPAAGVAYFGIAPYLAASPAVLGRAVPISSARVERALPSSARAGSINGSSRLGEADQSTALPRADPFAPSRQTKFQEEASRVRTSAAPSLSTHIQAATLPGAQLAPSANHLSLGAGFGAPFLYVASADAGAAARAAAAAQSAARAAGGAEINQVRCT